MFGLQIETVLRSDPCVANYFLGVFTADVLESLEYDLSHPWVLVCNSDGNTQNVGHWVAFAYAYSTLFFFDSLGGTLECNGVFKNFISKFFCKGIEIRTVVQNGPLQGPSSLACGEYCIFFIREICYNKSIEAICQELYEALETERDDLVCNYVENISPQAAEVYEKNYAVNFLIRLDFQPLVVLNWLITGAVSIIVATFIFCILLLLIFKYMIQYMYIKHIYQELKSRKKVWKPYSTTKRSFLDIETD